MLHSYVAEHCPGSPTAYIRAARLRERAPEIPVAIVDIGTPGAVVPPAVVGTPTWNDRIIFLGNPSAQELLERARSLHERAAS